MTHVETSAYGALDAFGILELYAALLLGDDEDAKQKEQDLGDLSVIEGIYKSLGTYRVLFSHKYRL